MEFWYRWRGWLWLTALIPATLITIWPSHRWLNLLALIWIAAIGVIYFYMEQKIYKKQMSLTIQSTHKQWITTMNHHRHDWMNDLQVLFGYIRLGKEDKIVKYIEQIKGKIHGESAISKLNEPMLVSFLMSFRTTSSPFELKIDILSGEDQHSINIEDEQISELLITIILAYRLYVQHDSNEDLVLALQFENNGSSLNIHVSFNGEIKSEQLWKQKIEQQLKGTNSVQMIGALSFDQFDLQITSP